MFRVLIRSCTQFRSRVTIFFFNDTATTEIYTLSLHDALPISTCPLVTKVHREAVKFAADGYTIVLIGHSGHEEVEGTMGEAPDHIVLVETEEDVDRLEVADPQKVAYISQTTLSVDETRAIIARLRERFPAITGPRTDDICYATTNRQAAVKAMAEQCDLVLVIGSPNSSHSQPLVAVAREDGADSYLTIGRASW